MNKTLQKIKDEYAIEEHCLENFDQLIRVDEITDRDVDQIAIRYAQEQNKELVVMLKECEEWIGNCNQYAPILKVIDKLIKSATET